MKKVILDFLACPNCGNPETEGRLCNLTCRRAFNGSGKSERTLEIERLLMIGLTPAKIAHELNISRERVYQIKQTLTQPTRAEMRERLRIDDFDPLTAFAVKPWEQSELQTMW